MNDVIDFFQGLFSTKEWPARWNCGYWSDFHGWLYIVSDMMIWFAYFAIPTIIILYIQKKKLVIRYRTGYFLFAAFILLCGSTHYIDVIMFWFPMYRLNALVRFMTGVVSIATVFYLLKIIPEAFKGKTSEELKKEIEKRELAEQRLEEANQNLRAFAYVASHDLQEPLRKISTFTSMLGDLNKHKFDPKSAELNEKIFGSAQRLQNMIKDILKLSSIEDAVELRPVNLNEVITQAIEDLEIKVAEKEAIIQVESIPLVQGNASYLKQLFYNLISNAIKFTEVKPVITIRVVRGEKDVKIEVKDNGIGMAQEETSKIFEVFKRLHSREKYEGTGIGLAICRRIVQVHSGSISVESTPGVGTTFTVCLLAADEPAS